MSVTNAVDGVAAESVVVQPFRVSMDNQKIPPVEWQTVLLVAINYAVFTLVCLFYHHLPWWIVLVIGAFVVALHGSLQHEAIHGHPTRNRQINEILIFPSLWLWLPYDIYRDSHLKHHEDDCITDPFEDPESYFVSRNKWETLAAWQRAGYVLRNTVGGRLLLGPLWACVTLWRDEIKRLVREDTSYLAAWFRHFISVVLMLLWLRYVEIPLYEYILLFAYPGMSLTMLRSFLEHQTDMSPARRTVVVKSGKIMGLLFLNNNLHALHHEKPALPWYRLPQVWRQSSRQILERNGGYYYRSYLQVIKKYLFSPKVHPRHPHR